MVKRFLIPLALLFGSCATPKTVEIFSQLEQYGDCEIGGKGIDTCFVYDGSENLPLWICDSLTIVQYMNKYVKDDLLTNAKSGKIGFEIIIFNDGRTCCSAISNWTDTELNLHAYRDAIAQMPLWKPIKKDGIDDKCKISMEFTILNGKFVDK